MISGVVLARNEEANIIGCLEALKPHVDEILLIDMESTDHTVKLATPYVDRILSHHLLRNFDGARNIAIDEARHKWLWFVDADERIPDATGRLVRDIVRTHGHDFEAISIPFKSYCGGNWMKHCGWWPGYTGPRVLKRGHFRFADRIHGGVQLEGRELRVAPDPDLGIDHYGIRDLEHYVEKVNRYSSAEAENLIKEGTPWDWRIAIADMMQEMWLTYERCPGNLDGKWGWIAAWMSGQYRWLANSKLVDWNYEAQLGGDTSAVPTDLDEVVQCMEDSLARLRANQPALPLGLVWKASIDNASGYAEEARTFLKGLAYGTRPLALESPFTCRGPDASVPADDDVLFRALRRARRPRHTITVTHALPGVVDPDKRSAVNVLRTMIETDRVPAAWIPHIAKFDVVWVPSQHSADAFRRSWIAPEKIRIVPGCLDTRIFHPTGEKYALPSELHDRFVFLSVFDWTPRKGGELLLENYCREFTPDEGAGLLVKLTRIHGMSLKEIEAKADSCLKAIGQSLSERPDIFLLDQELSTVEMAALYRSADAFVLPSRGEGWGRPFMEAMACGLPTIGTAATGQMEFMNETNSLLVPAKIVEIPEQAVHEFPLFTGHRWHEPDTTELRRLMRLIMKDEGLRQRIGQRASEEVRIRFTLEAGAQAVESAVKTAERRFAISSVPSVKSDQKRVVLEGELFSGHSFSNINERLCRLLALDTSLALSIRRRPTGLMEERPSFASELEPLIDRELPGGPQITIRHAYPPDWTPPRQGHWVHVQPWEYGHLPATWIAPLRDQVDEIWVPSHYVQRIYERSGIPSEKIQVIPWGFDSEIFNPDAPALILPTGKTFNFLYVGGTIARKGFDRLLKAYLEEFEPSEDVGLVVKDIGSRTVYLHNNYAHEAVDAQNDPTKPVLFYLDSPLTQGQLASLFTACDCLVAPYRGEGFGLPILEAMACGVAPMIPQGGASDDFATQENAFLLNSQEIEAKPEMPLCGPLLELDVSPSELRQLMRQAVVKYEETKSRGRAAAISVRDKFTWHRTVERMIERITLLAGHTPNSMLITSTPNNRRRNCPVTAVVVTPEDSSTFVDTLASLRPFVDRVICVTENPTKYVAALAQEYGAELVSSVEDIICDKDWVLRVKSGEQPSDQGLERLKDFLAGLPSQIRSVGVEIVIQDNVGRPIHRQTEIRLKHGELPDLLDGPSFRQNHSEISQGVAFAMADLEIIARPRDLAGALHLQHSSLT